MKKISITTTILTTNALNWCLTTKTNVKMAAKAVLVVEFNLQNLELLSHLLSPNGSKTAFRMLKRAVFNPLQQAKGLLNQTKGLIYLKWQFLSQTAKTPQEAYLWI